MHILSQGKYASMQKKMRYVLDTYNIISGEVVSYEKSFIKFSPDTPNELINTLKILLRVNERKEVETYLGCLMEADGRPTTKFQPISDKIIKY